MSVFFRSGLSQEPFTACFSVHAAADPSVMPRVIDVFARRGLVPSALYSTLCGTVEEELQIDVQVNGLDRGGAEKLAQSLRQLVCVGAVLTSEKRFALSA